MHLNFNEEVIPYNANQLFKMLLINCQVDRAVNKQWLISTLCSDGLMKFWGKIFSPSILMRNCINLKFSYLLTVYIMIWDKFFLLLFSQFQDT